MKLLIVDDEELTRNGLARALNWSAFGIAEPVQASDGTEGLTVALQEKPDIVLCDVRMPKMSGIEMLKKIEACQPDVAAIFMSGYSDKEYLKAAIQLKAVRYIEKPIESRELAAAVKNAVDQRRTALRHRTAEAIHSNVAATQLAFYLTVPYADCRPSVEKLRSDFHQHYGTDKFKSVTSFVVRPEHPPVGTTDYVLIHQSIHAFLMPKHLHIIYTAQRAPNIVYHIYSVTTPDKALLLTVADRLKKCFAPFGDCYIAVGETVKGIENAYRSYHSAAAALQNSFLFEPGTLLTPALLHSDTHAGACSLKQHTTEYQQGIKERDCKKAEQALALLAQSCEHANDLTPNQVRALYYDLFSALSANRSSQKLPLDTDLANHENIIEALNSCFSFKQLHSLLVKKTKAYFHDLDHYIPENSTIFLIREFVANHYDDQGLSVNEISKHVFLSVSYVCTFFKSETGYTLNRYITKYRMEKAKQMLADPRYKITDISTAVGYSDGGYFGKSFRKHVGVSPSEYREKALR
ncbi:MAG: response regulator [Oscillospiraceae bacterium]|jgi:two-component system response regulator YesN|nr:response regulator [Oscillospiraceae bacterium]